MTAVLVAEDEVDILRLIVSELDHAGYRVHSATDGGAAVAVARAVTPDLALLDLEMPRLSGVHVCRYLRHLPGGAHLPIVVMASGPAGGLAADGLAAGANDYLIKPFSPQEMLARVDALLRPARTAAVAARCASGAALTGLRGMF